MPNTPEHKAEMHALARARRRAGKPVWEQKVKLPDVRDLEFERKREAIGTALERSAWIQDQPAEATVLRYLRELHEAEDDEDLHLWMEGIYDVADHERVWIEVDYEKKS